MRVLPMLLAATVAVATPAIALAQPNAAASPGIGHSVFMRGTVVRASDDRVVVCVGKSDGAEAGQQLTVYRVSEHRHRPNSPPTFVREPVGSVRIDRIIDDHFADATVVSGTVKRHDIVELTRS